MSYHPPFPHPTPVWITKLVKSYGCILSVTITGICLKPATLVLHCKATKSCFISIVCSLIWEYIIWECNALVSVTDYFWKNVCIGTSRWSSACQLHSKNATGIASIFKKPVSEWIWPYQYFLFFSHPVMANQHVLLTSRLYFGFERWRDKKKMWGEARQEVGQRMGYWGATEGWGMWPKQSLHRIKGPMAGFKLFILLVRLSPIGSMHSPPIQTIRF